MANPTPRTLRIAVYTRQSVEDTSGSEFTSIDAQRRAIECYIASQAHEGWVASPERYDDAGYSGATTERPAFRRLLHDVEAGRIQGVAVYRFDRLSRSVADFARLMRAFEERGVVFVAVTQNINSATSAGKLLVNILASFAEFERDQIAERTRDKMGAARKRGMYQGGPMALGYDVVNRKLVVNPTEAEIVRALFRSYLERGSLTRVLDEADARGWRNKQWTTREGREYGGGAFSSGTLRYFLTNPLYRGKVLYEGELYDGEHEAIVDEETWGAVQRQLGAQRRGAPGKARRPSGTFLKGLVKCGACGRGMSPSWTRKRDGRVYRYLVCDAIDERGAAACPGARVSVGVLEEAVLGHLRRVAATPAIAAEVLEAAERERARGRKEARAEVALAQRQLSRLERAGARDGDGARDTSDRAAAEAQLSSARARAEALAVPLDPERLRAELQVFTEVFAALEPHERAQVAGLLVERVEYRADPEGYRVCLRQDIAAALATLPTAP